MAFKGVFVLRAAPIALLLMFGSQAGAECGKLCEEDWWKTSTTGDVQAELDGGADVTARDKYGVTPLHAAAALGKPATIQALLAAGAHVMARGKYGATPLHYAARWDTPENIQALLAAGADVMVQNKDGKIPWDYAKNKDGVDETDEYTALKKATCGWVCWFKNLVGLCG